MQSSPIVSAIILNFRSPKDTVKCVQALQKQTIAKDMEILVVDNGSEDESIGTFRNRFKDMKNVRIVETPENLGYGKGNNFALDHAKGEFVLIINPDNELEPSGLETMVKIMRKYDDIGILAPKLVYPDGTVRESYRRFPSIADILIKRSFLRKIFRKRLEHYLQSEKKLEGVHGTDWLAGACLLIPRSLMKEMKGFDPRFFLFFEDTDLCRRCWKLGRKVMYCPSVEAKDSQERLSGGGFVPILFTKTGRMHIASAIRYFWKWKGVRK